MKVFLRFVRCLLLLFTRLFWVFLWFCYIVFLFSRQYFGGYSYYRLPSFRISLSVLQMFLGFSQFPFWLSHKNLKTTKVFLRLDPRFPSAFLPLLAISSAFTPVFFRFPFLLDGTDRRMKSQPGSAAAGQARALEAFAGEGWRVRHRTALSLHRIYLRDPT